MTEHLLKAAADSIGKVIEMMRLTKQQIEVTMFSTGAGILEGPKVGKLMNRP
jgi:hypothetical protein